MNRNTRIIVEFVGLIVILSALIAGIAASIKDYNQRIKIIDHNYCTQIEGHSLKECADLGR